MSTLDSRVEQLEKDLQRVESAHNSGMSQPCIEKTISIVENKLVTMYEKIKLENRLFISDLRDELKCLVTQAISSLNNDFEKRLEKVLMEVRSGLDEYIKTQKDKNNWGVEVLRTFIMIVMFFIAIGILKGHV